MHFISSAMASFCLETTVEDAMQTVRDAGFDSLDFPLSVYSRPQDAPLRGDNWRQWARGVRRTADRIGLPITQAHASWEQAIPDDLHYESPYEIYERTMEACAIRCCICTACRIEASGRASTIGTSAGSTSFCHWRRSSTL